MNDNELSETSQWAEVFAGETPQSLRAALGVLAGLINEPEPFLNCARAINIKNDLARRITMAEIVYDVCQKYSLTHAQMVSPVRNQSYARPRQELMFRVFTEVPHVSLPEMGRRICRDHTTCIHGVKKHCERIGIAYIDAVAMRVLSARERGYALPRYGGNSSPIYAQ